MSAQISLPEQTGRVQSRLAATLFAAGALPLTLVVAAGLGIGFIGWYALIGRVRGSESLHDLLLFTCLPLGVAGTLLAWHRYGKYFAERADVDLPTAMRWDSPSWAALAFGVAGILAPLSGLSPSRAVGIGIALFALIKLLVAAIFNLTVRDVLLTFVTTRIPILMIAELASVLIGQRPGQHVAASTNPLLAVWGRWDAVHYLDIARRGYYGTDMAFFPLYPGLIKVVSLFIGDRLLAGLLISNVALFFGCLFFYKLVEHQYNRTIAHRAVFYVSIFPTAIFFSAVYTEALFFALTVASFYYIREKKWLTAGLLGGLAAMTRVEGVLLFVPFAIEALFPEGRFAGRELLTFSTRTLRVLAGSALIPLGLLAYMGLLWVLRGDPLYFTHVQSHWDRHLAFPWVSIIHAFQTIAKTHLPVTLAGQVIELAFTTLMLGVLVASIGRMRWSYWVYMLLSIVVPMSTSSLMSMPRFALVLFPMFMMLAVWGTRPAVNNAIVSFSLSLLGLFTVLFADWYWVA
jgi:hypothetical protein